MQAFATSLAENWNSQDERCSLMRATLARHQCRLSAEEFVAH